MKILVLVLLTAPVLSAQRTLVVDFVNGPYYTIQAGVDAAVRGDTVLVRGSSSSSFAGATVTKGIQLLGETTIRLGTPLIVRDIKRGEHLTIKGFRLAELGANRSIRCSNCAGSVHLEAVEVRGSSSGAGLYVENCLFVSGTDCQFDAGADYVLSRYSNLGRGLEVRSGNLVLVRCTARGVGFVQGGGRRVFLASYEGILATASHIVLVDTTVTGGFGSCAQVFSSCALLQSPRPAILAGGASRIIAKNSTLTGGIGGLGLCGPCSGAPAPGILADATTDIVRDPAVAFTVSGGRVVTRNVWDLQAAGRPPGQAVSITIRGSGSAIFGVFANHPDQPVGVPLAAWLDPSNPVLLHADAVQNTRTTRIVAPSYLPVGLPVALQALVLEPGGFTVSTPVVIALY